MKSLFILNYNNKFNNLINLNYNFNYLNKLINKIFIKIKKYKKYKNKINIIEVINKQIKHLKYNFFLQFEDKEIIKYLLFLKFKYNISINLFDNLNFIILIINYINNNNKILLDIINKNLVKWSLYRINIIDLIIIKIAITEYIIYYNNININIIIKEYNFIISIFSTKKNINFTNGILNNILNSKIIISLYEKYK
ncbi:transcription antitermination factor NusB [Candidatus Shikimatogenerans bostrichidophilus]|uniref:transcription antitermination factor NusB n=1 Tax=Candidatus Shikimatogenerans bostrichidophilus TaxID=2943807 RepID=UPI002965F14C